MRHEALALLMTALVVPAAGCASKEYVREVVGQSQAKLDAQIREQGQILGAQTQRAEAQTARLDAQAKQLDEIGGRFTKLETSIDEFGSIVRSASTKADEAAVRAEEVSNRASRLVASGNKRRLVETIRVQFALNRADLTDATQTALAALIKELAENPALTVDLEGYTDSTGTVEYNLELSDRRVSAVRRFLVSHGVDLARINWIGMGQLSDRGPAERAKNRRVTLRLMLPEGELAPQRTSSKPGESRGAPASASAPETPKSPGAEPAVAKPAPEAPSEPASPSAENPKEPAPEAPMPASTGGAGEEPTEQRAPSQ